MATPFVITLMNPQIINIIHAIEYIRSLVLISFFGLLSYVIAIITTPVIIFIESDRNTILYSLPLSKEDVIVSKTIASTILYQPVPLTLLLLTSIVLSPIHGFIVYYSSTMFWILGSYFSFKIILSILWGKLGAWTEFSLGVIKRILIILALIFPLGIFLAITISLYITLPLSALLTILITPLPIAAYVFVKTLVKD